jgi:hypothetical protein
MSLPPKIPFIIQAQPEVEGKAGRTKVAPEGLATVANQLMLPVG